MFKVKNVVLTLALLVVVIVLCLGPKDIHPCPDCGRAMDLINTMEFKEGLPLKLYRCKICDLEYLTTDYSSSQTDQ